MNDALRMQISAFVDGELPDNETELLLRRLSQDPVMRELVSDYLKIGRLIRRERELPGAFALRSRIQAALGEQPAEPVVVSGSGGSRFLRPLTGLAIASAVAAVALLVLRQVEIPNANAPGVVAREQSTPAAAADTGYTEPQPAAAIDGRPSELLMQYYLSHGATSRDLGANGILTRLVTLELRGGELVDVVPADATRLGDEVDRDSGEREAGEAQERTGDER